jgi:O-antigen ligase
MLIAIILTILILYAIFFLFDRRKAILSLYLIKLPLDQFAWRVSLGFMDLRLSEVFTLLITILLSIILIMDRIKDPDRLGFWGNIPSKVRIPILMFFILCLMNVLFAQAKIFTLQSVFKLLTGFVIGTFTAKIITTEEDIYSLIKIMTISVIVIFVSVMPDLFSGGQLQVFAPTSDDPYKGTYISGGASKYYSADGFAFAFLVYIPAILLFSNVYKQKWEFLLCIFAMLFVSIAVFASAIRIAWISFIVILSIWIIVNKKWKLSVVIVFLISILFVTNILDKPFQTAIQKSNYEIESFKKGELPSEYAFNARPKMWKFYMSNYMMLPLLDKAFGSEKTMRVSFSSIGYSTHNDFLYILIRMGFIGLGITLFLYIYLFLQIIKIIRKSNRSYFDWQIGLTAILGLIGMLLPALTRAGLTNPNFQWFFWTFAMIALKGNYILEPQNNEAIDYGKNEILSSEL